MNEWITTVLAKLEMDSENSTIFIIVKTLLMDIKLTNNWILLTDNYVQCNTFVLPLLSIKLHFIISDTTFRNNNKSHASIYGHCANVYIYYKYEWQCWKNDWYYTSSNVSD